MSTITYYVAMPFIRTEEEALVPGEAMEMPNATAAIRKASMLAMVNAGAVAFSRTGDPSIGEFRDAVLLQRFGDVPTDLFEL